MTAQKWSRILASVALVLALLTQNVVAQTAQPAKTVATVNGQAITMTDVDSVLKRQPPPPHPLTELQRRQMQLEIVGMLIDDMLMQQFLRQHGPKIAPADVEKELASLTTGLKTQGKTLADFCRDTDQTEAQLRQNILNVLQWNGYVKGLVTDDAVKRYYDENKAFFDQVQVRASHILLRVSANGSEGDRQAARAKLQAVHKDIVAGTLKFEDAVSKYSQCPTAANGGDIGYFSRKLMVDENVAQAAFSMKVGEVSAPIDTEYGVHLVKVTDRKPGTPSLFDKIKDEVRELCIEDLRQNMLAKMRKESKIVMNLP